MLTRQQIDTCDVTHKYAGNGFVVVQDMGDDYVRVTGDVNVGGIVYLAWSKLLSVTTIENTDPKTKETVVSSKVLNEKELTQLNKIRAGLKSGELVVVNHRIRNSR